MSDAELFQSRARALGVSPRSLAARTRRSLKSAREIIAKLALPYADIDNSVEGAQRELMAEFDHFEKTIGETVGWLEEPIGS